MQFLGLSKKSDGPKPLKKPKPLVPMTQDEVDQFMAQAHNAEVAQQLSRPGAMVLDTPLSRKRSWKEMMDVFDRTGITQRRGTILQESDLPKGTLTSRAIGKKR
jgi:hypothetical protein